jgi:hypothetical protein
MTGFRPARLLAVTATGTAVCLSVLAGWQRGGTLSERVVWVAIGVVLVVSAHLLPALIRESSFVVRGIGSLLWVTCMMTAGYGHLTFFLLAQQHAGERRSAVLLVIPPSPARSLTVTTQLVWVDTRRCSRDCAGLDARRVTLAAKLDALNAEADDVRRQQAERDRVMAQRDSLRADPVTSRLAVLLGVSTTRVDVLSGLVFAAVLEGVACLLWTVALRPPFLPASVPVVTNATPTQAQPVANVTAVPQRAVKAVAASHVAETVSRETVTGGHAAVTDSHAPRDDPVTPLPDESSPDDDVIQLVRDVEAGRLRPTVADIRRYLVPLC